jgi:D-alanine-D-alanine ligase
MGKKKINVGILFGGKSAEHEVSLQSAKNVIDAIDKGKYHPILIGIDKSGRWLLNDCTRFLLNPDNPRLIKLNQSSDHIALIPQNRGKISNLTKVGSDESVDVIFPILHGPFGEDGTVQGLLKLADIPFVGASVLGSAVAMDKDIMKRLLRDARLPIADFIPLKNEDDLPAFETISTRLGVPFFVKPANLGSSIGINKVIDETDYKLAIRQAFDYDNKILIEEYIEGREIECSVLGNNEPIASVPGEVIPKHEFYSYEAKYIDEKGAALEIPARLPVEITKRIQEIAITTFKVLSCEGMGRVDFFLKNNDEIIVNELNTIPGFTAISMYPRLWEASGISYSDLIDRLIQLAFERFKKEQQLKTSHKARKS